MDRRELLQWMNLNLLFSRLNNMNNAMNRMKASQIGIFLVIVMIICGSWGFLVHRTIHQLAVYELPNEIRPFFYKNIEKIVADAPRPDQRRNTDSTEAPKHFIDLEMYGEDAAHNMPFDWQKAVKQYSKDSLEKYGYVPYHVIYMKYKLTEAFKQKNKDSILFYAADIGHYIGDAHVPLHTTVNYDGQLTNQKGLHSLWESMIPELEIDQYQLYSSHKATYLKDPAAAIWKAVRTGFAMVPEMLAKETEVSKNFTEATKYRVQIRRGRESKNYSTAFAKAYAASLKPSINQRLLQSADLIADFWYTAWVDAGKPDLKNITTNWTETDQQQLNKELELFKKNELLKQQLLISRKQQQQENN
ncbi:MAG: hypothetical protein RLZZ429_91 [Bacteroidota bacterium]